MYKSKKYNSAPSGALREGIGTKIDTTLVPHELIVLAAVGLNYGAEKYSPRNFEKGFRISDLTNSIDRHNRALMAGEANDPDSGLPHVALLTSSIAMLAFCYMQDRLDMDMPARDESVRSVEHVSKLAQEMLNNRKTNNDN